MRVYRNNVPMSTKKKKYVDICDNGTYNDTNGTQERRKTNGGQRENANQ